MMLIYFASDGCIDDVVNNRTSHQFTLVYFMNSARVCWTIRRTVFNVYFCLRDINTVGDISTTNLNGLMKNQDIKGSFFKT